ncbi:unnamed protein product [Bemisia tabaci]|uniref:CS domain-containing protein n=1 Tax=Bemisia tabaci TaxID=7038 RepID=A0A9P0AC39_BEMTA|nr:PREDICTED: prostaglandin E synthase 3 [Bemisia tabaci]CAH0388595.1 unnamed protein product [Bemisia tabaci]
MSKEEAAIPPPIIWAQRSGVVFVTINVEDCKDPDIKIEEDKFYFKSVGGVEKKLYEVTVPLYKEIDPEKSVKHVRERQIELVLKKKEDKGPYWPHLTKEKNKYHWLKVDFNKWKDEDDSEDDMEGMEGGGFDDLMRSMGGMGGMGGGDDKPSFEGMDDEDSDDEDLPDLEE